MSFGAYLGQKARSIASLGAKAYTTAGAGLSIGSKYTGAAAGLATAVTGAAAATGLTMSAPFAAAAAGIVGVHAGVRAVQAAGQAAEGVYSTIAGDAKSPLER
jgi:hypothetical protein